MKNRICTYKSIIRVSGIYDIIILLPFLFPQLIELTFQYIHKLHFLLSLNGAPIEMSPIAYLFTNIMAAISIMWGVVRILKREKIIAFADTIIRFTIAGLMFYYLLFQAVSQIIWIFFIAEIAWGIIQLFSLYKSDTSALE